MGRIGRNGRKIYNNGRVTGIMTNGPPYERVKYHAQDRYGPNCRRCGDWISDAPPDIHYPWGKTPRPKAKPTLEGSIHLQDAKEYYAELLRRMANGPEAGMPHPLWVAKCACKLATSLRNASSPLYGNQWRKFGDWLKRSTREGNTYARDMYAQVLELAPAANEFTHRLRGVRNVVSYYPDQAFC